MNWVDVVMLAVVGLSGAAGFLRGLTREMLGLLAWIAAAVLAGHFYGRLQPMVHGWIADEQFAAIACFVVLFLAILIGLSMLAGLVSRVVRLSLLGGLDRLLGAVFGLVRGGALLVLAYMVFKLVLTPDMWPRPVRDAGALPLLGRSAQYALTQVPRSWQSVLPRLAPDEAGRSAERSF